MKKCPFCAEEIQDEALKCKHCGSELTETTGAGEEKTLAEYHPSWWNWPADLFFFWLLFPILDCWLRTKSYTYTITTHRVTARSGLISRNTSEVDIKDIRGIDVKQGIFQRIIGIGDVVVGSAASGGMEVVLAGVKSPVEIKEKILALKRTP